MPDVNYRLESDVAVLEIANPPVNALSIHVREGLVEGLRRAASEGAVQAIVICGARGAFPAGADIKEIASGLSHKSPIIREVQARMEASDKPIVAAIEGTALGKEYVYECGTLRTVAAFIEPLALQPERFILRQKAGGLDAVDDLRRSQLPTGLGGDARAKGRKDRPVDVGDTVVDIARQAQLAPLSDGLARKFNRRDHGVVGQLVDDTQFLSAGSRNVRSGGDCLERRLRSGQSRESLRTAGTGDQSEPDLR